MCLFCRSISSVFFGSLSTQRKVNGMCNFRMYLNLIQQRYFEDGIAQWLNRKIYIRPLKKQINNHKLRRHTFNKVQLIWRCMENIDAIMTKSSSIQSLLSMILENYSCNNVWLLHQSAANFTICPNYKKTVRCNDSMLHSFTFSRQGSWILELTLPHAWITFNIISADYYKKLSLISCT